MKEVLNMKLTEKLILTFVAAFILATATNTFKTIATSHAALIRAHLVGGIK